MRLLVTLCCFFLSAAWLNAQNQAIPHHCYDHTAHQSRDFHPCGAPPVKSAWLKEYQRNPEAFRHLIQNRTGTTYLPMTFHIVGQDDSTGYANLDNVFGSFCQLNADYAPYGIEFFIEPPIRYIANSDFYSHDSVLIGGGFMLDYNVDSTINVYFMADPAGNCGYNLPYAGVAMNNGCLGGHTFAHELGHQLSIQHTFYGWEGGISWDGSIPTDFDAPAPTQVLLNYTSFKDTMWQDTLIIDTAYVEYVTRTGLNANCAFAADGFCDTEADYLAYRWACDGAGFSTVSQLDPDSVEFVSDGWNIMTYAFDNCQGGFSNEQINAMNAFIQSERQHQLYNQNPMRDTINHTPDLMMPAAGETVANDGALTFTWNSVPGATHYILQVTKLQNTYTPDQLVENLILSDTTFTSLEDYPTRPSFLPYYWRVKPFNYGYTCASYTNSQSFNTELASDVRTLASVQNFQVYPNPSTQGTSVIVELGLEQQMDVILECFTPTGQSFYKKQYALQQGNQQLNLPTTDWPTGVYFLRISGHEGQWTKKMIITNK